LRLLVSNTDLDTDQPTPCQNIKDRPGDLSMCKPSIARRTGVSFDPTIDPLTNIQINRGGVDTKRCITRCFTSIKPCGVSRLSAQVTTRCVGYDPPCVVGSASIMISEASVHSSPAVSNERMPQVRNLLRVV
jgi:hypothetical protein